MPLVFMFIVARRREPTDITFIDPKTGCPETFMARTAKACGIKAGILSRRWSAEERQRKLSCCAGDRLRSAPLSWTR